MIKTNKKLESKMKNTLPIYSLSSFLFNLKKFTLTAPFILKPTNTPITANKTLKLAVIPYISWC